MPTLPMSSQVETWARVNDTESRVSAGQHDCPDRGVCAELRERGPQVAQLRSGQRVAPLRRVKCRR